MQAMRRALWTALQLGAVAFFFVVGGAILSWPSALPYEEAKARWGKDMTITCAGYVSRANRSHTRFYCNSFRDQFDGTVGIALLVWAFVGNTFIMIASVQPNRGLFGGGRRRNTELTPPTPHPQQKMQ